MQQRVDSIVGSLAKWHGLYAAYIKTFSEFATELKENILSMQPKYLPEGSVLVTALGKTSFTVSALDREIVFACEPHLNGHNDYQGRIRVYLSKAPVLKPDGRVLLGDFYFKRDLTTSFGDPDDITHLEGGDGIYLALSFVQKGLAYDKVQS